MIIVALQDCQRAAHPEKPKIICFTFNGSHFIFIKIKMLFFCRQIAKLFHSQLEKAEAPQLFILLISKHGPNVSNVL